MKIQIPRRFQGPPTMGHGGYVSGLFASRTPGAVQVTLRRPTPLDREIELRELGDGKLALVDGETVTAESEPSSLELEVPPAPGLEQARAAEAQSPSLYNDGRGVHPTCFGCGNQHEAGDALRIFVGPTEVEGREVVAGAWRPAPGFAGDDGSVDRLWVLSALDCPGAFAFIAAKQRAGLLGRIVFEQYETVSAERDYVVMGWQAGQDGRKLFAGTALFGEDGTLHAAARATWFQMAPRKK